jgi:hypothetical protein
MDRVLKKFSLLRPALLAAVAAITSVAWSADTAKQTNSQASSASSKSAATAQTAHYHTDRFAGRAGKYYELIWGIDSISVKLVESGDLVRFSYRVLDPTKAAALNDKQNQASLVDPRAGVSLVVPSMEKVGQLRQSAPPEEGRSYWMAFSNKGRLVRRGDRVDVVVGRFRASNLAVD